MGSGNIKKFELKLGRTGLIILITGMTVLLCLSFILGVGVGKNIDTYPEKISSLPQSVLALFWRPAKIASQQGIMDSKENPPNKGNMDLAFHNALTNQKTPSIQKLPAVEKKPNDNVTTDQKVAPHIKSAVLPPQEEMVSSKGEPDEKKILDSERSPAEIKSRTKEVLTPVSPAGSLFIIHVASLKDKAKASQINGTVTTLGYSSKIVKVDIKGKGIWYRVIATGFKTKAQALSAVEKISKKVKTNCIIRSADMDVEKN